MSGPGKVVVLLLLLAAVSAAIWLQAHRLSAEEISYSRFLRDLEADQLDRIAVRGLSASGTYKDGKAFRVQLPYLDPQLADDIAQHAEVFFDEDPWWERIAIFALPAMAAGLALGIVIRWRSRTA